MQVPATDIAEAAAAGRHARNRAVMAAVAAGTLVLGAGFAWWTRGSPMNAALFLSPYLVMMPAVALLRAGWTGATQRETPWPLWWVTFLVTSPWPVILIVNEVNVAFFRELALYGWLAERLQLLVYTLVDAAQVFWGVALCAFVVGMVAARWRKNRLREALLDAPPEPVRTPEVSQAARRARAQETLRAP